MKARNWSVQLGKCWHGSLCCAAGGVQPMSPAHIVREIAPTVENVKNVIGQFFPGMKIDEQDMTVKEQISNTLDCGFFSVDLAGGDEYESLFVSFTEI